MKRWIPIAAALLLRACGSGGGHLAFAAVPQMPFTFLAQPLTGEPTNGSPRAVFLLDAGASIGVSFLTVDQATGNPYGSNGTLLYMDQEAMRVDSVSNGVVYVERGVQGTRVTSHYALAKVWVATARYFAQRSPTPPCNPYSLTVAPTVVIPSGQAFNCNYSSEIWQTETVTWPSITFRWNAWPSPASVWTRISIDNGAWEIAALPWSPSSPQRSWLSATWTWNQPWH